MFEYICGKLNFPWEAVQCLEENLEKIRSNPAASEDLEQAVKSLLTPECDCYEKLMQKIADETGIHRFTVDMVVLVCGVEPLTEVYRQKNLPEDLLWATMEDLKYKLVECRDVYGIWGTFVTPWFKWFYTCNRFKFGRLQFEKTELSSADDCGTYPRKGDIVINCHIPSCGPLKKEEVLKSIDQAYGFYQDLFADKVMALTCYSWLLYTPFMGRVFPEHSNIYEFAHLFRIIKTWPDATNSDFWRVFNKSYSPEILDQVKTDTTMRRNLLEFIREGNCMGAGMGLIRYDGEKILP